VVSLKKTTLDSAAVEGHLKPRPSTRLIYMCSSKLPKLTLSLWEQSLRSEAEIPTWQELNAFLTERHLTLEAIISAKYIRPHCSASKNKF